MCIFLKILQRNLLSNHIFLSVEQKHPCLHTQGLSRPVSSQLLPEVSEDNLDENVLMETHLCWTLRNKPGRASCEGVYAKKEDRDFILD